MKKFIFDCLPHEVPQYLLEKFPPELIARPGDLPSGVIGTALPWGSVDVALIQRVIDAYGTGSYLVYLFLVTDTTHPFDIPANVRLFTTSALKSLIRPRTEILPYVWQCQDQAFEPLPRVGLPTVGFCGLASEHRIQTLSSFARCRSVQTDFILRDRFWGGSPGDPQLISEFNQNLAGSHFTVCNRGAGNFSMRFYQTLAAGRVPILLDTDILLPFSDQIDWKSEIIFEGSPDELVSRLLDTWRTRDIVAMQKRCRSIFDAYFAGGKFFMHALNNGEQNEVTAGIGDVFASAVAAS